MGPQRANRSALFQAKRDSSHASESEEELRRSREGRPENWEDVKDQGELALGWEKVVRMDCVRT